MYQELEIIGLIISFLLIFLGVVYRIACKQIIKKFFSKLSSSQVNIAFSSLLALAIIGIIVCAYLVYPISYNKPVELDKEKSEVEQSIDDTKEIIEFGKEIGSEIKKNLHMGKDTSI